MAYAQHETGKNRTAAWNIFSYSRPKLVPAATIFSEQVSKSLNTANCLFEQEFVHCDYCQNHRRIFNLLSNSAEPTELLRIRAKFSNVEQAISQCKNLNNFEFAFACFNKLSNEEFLQNSSRLTVWFV